MWTPYLYAFNAISQLYVLPTHLLLAACPIVDTLFAWHVYKIGSAQPWLSL